MKSHLLILFVNIWLKWWKNNYGVQIGGKTHGRNCVKYVHSAWGYIVKAAEPKKLERNAENIFVMFVEQEEETFGQGSSDKLNSWIYSRKSTT